MKKKWVQELVIAIIMVAMVAGGMALSSITQVKYPLVRIAREATIWIFGEESTTMEAAKGSIPSGIGASLLGDNEILGNVVVNTFVASDINNYQNSWLFRVLSADKDSSQSIHLTDDLYIYKIIGNASSQTTNGYPLSRDYVGYIAYNSLDDTCINLFVDCQSIAGQAVIDEIRTVGDSYALSDFLESEVLSVEKFDASDSSYSYYVNSSITLPGPKGSIDYFATIVYDPSTEQCTVTADSQELTDELSTIVAAKKAAPLAVSQTLREIIRPFGIEPDLPAESISVTLSDMDTFRESGFYDPQNETVFENAYICKVSCPVQLPDSQNIYSYEAFVAYDAVSHTCTVKANPQQVDILTGDLAKSAAAQAVMDDIEQLETTAGVSVQVDTHSLSLAESTVDSYLASDIYKAWFSSGDDQDLAAFANGYVYETTCTIRIPVQPQAYTHHSFVICDPTTGKCIIRSDPELITKLTQQ